jgi:polynucleotide 5'-kinase involved in rRNA processing
MRVNKEAGAVTDNPYAALRDRLVGFNGVIMLLGLADTGKTELAKLIVSDAIAGGSSVAFVDGDVGSSVAGPPSTTGLKFVTDIADLDPAIAPAEMRFVGSTTPQGVVLPHVVAVAALVEQARPNVDLVVIDTSGVVAGVVGQTLKYHLAELIRPDLVVALQRGEELEPTIGMLRRFLSMKIATVEPASEVESPSPLERQERRSKAFGAALSPPVQRWRVQTTVFAPTLPEGFDPARLDGMLVGVLDDQGRCLGLGALEHDDGVLRVATHHGDAMRGLRLGSMRIDLETFDTQRVRLRQLIFGI